MKVRLRIVFAVLGAALFAGGLWAWSPWASLSALGLCLFVIGGFS